LCGWGDFAFQAHSELGAQNVEFREVYRARNERKRRHAQFGLWQRGSRRERDAGGSVMTTFLDLIVMLFWPLVSAAAAWAIAIYALAQKDEISEVVEALTGPNSVDEKRKASSNFSTPQQLERNCKRRSDWFQIHFGRMRHAAQNIKGRRTSDEKTAFARR
jgi:hypothetical protein